MDRDLHEKLVRNAARTDWGLPVTEFHANHPAPNFVERASPATCVAETPFDTARIKPMRGT